MPRPILARADALMQRRRQGSAETEDVPLLTDAIGNHDDIPVLLDADKKNNMILGAKPQT